MTIALTIYLVKKTENDYDVALPLILAAKSTFHDCGSLRSEGLNDDMILFSWLQFSSHNITAD
jgi:hypothetical protein